MNPNATLSTNDNHDDWRIALYYCYVPLNEDATVAQHISFQKSCCQERELMGRIRVSPEGVNGVVSGRFDALKDYEQQMRDELQRIILIRKQQHDEQSNLSSVDQEQEQQDQDERCWILDLDVKYCHLHTHLPVSSQLFDSLSVKPTREVVSLFEPTESSSSKAPLNPDQRKYYWRRRRRRQKQQPPKDEIVERTSNMIHPDNEIHNNEDETMPSTKILPSVLTPIILDKFQPAPHLSPQQWHEQLLKTSMQLASTEHQASTNAGSLDASPTDTSTAPHAAVLLDARNVYESRVGFFSAPHIPTILANTRKYSDLPKVMQEVACQLSDKDVYMYCTGGVRCERASMYLQALSQSAIWNAKLPPPKRIFQLQGGIQRYLEEYGQWEQQSALSTATLPHQDNAFDDECADTKDAARVTATGNASSVATTAAAKSLFRGKNFVFDPRRTDPRVSKEVVGRCLLCGIPHDDYDNGAAPCEEQEARCQKCRVLLLVCPSCRPTVQWKPTTSSTNNASRDYMNDHDNDYSDDNNTPLPPLLCGKDQCVDEGNSLNQIATVLYHPSAS